MHIYYKGNILLKWHFKSMGKKDDSQLLQQLANYLWENGILTSFFYSKMNSR